jgi:GT2 family glycosyltransferase
MDAEADIIILSWNRVDETIAAVASAAEQVDVEKRILIVDQGSKPENIAALEEYLKQVPCAELRKLEHNVGVAAGRNHASAMGCSRYIIALDSDAVFADKHTVARAVAHMNANPNLCAIGFRILNYFTRDNDPSSWDYPSERSPHQLFPSTRFVGAGHAIRRTTFEAVGGYDDRLFFCLEETDLCYRMLNTGMRIE